MTGARETSKGVGTVCIIATVSIVHSTFVDIYVFNTQTQLIAYSVLFLFLLLFSIFTFCRVGETQTVGVCVRVMCAIDDVGADRPFDLAAPSTARAPDFSETRQRRLYTSAAQAPDFSEK